MSSIPPEKLAWMAAVLEMEGRIRRPANPTRATQQLILQVESSRLGVVKELCRLTGQHPETRPDLRGKAWDRRGCTEHCEEAHVHVEIEKQPAITRWSVTGASAAIVLHSVIPYMVTDRGMTALLEEALAQVELRGRSGNSARQAVARLAGLGWRLPPKIDRQFRALVSAA